MGKISLRGLFVRYLRTLHSIDDDSLYIPDAFVHFVIPFGLFIWAIIKSDSAAAVRAYFANAMTAISVISGFMCGLAVMIFELRINLNQTNGELGENAQEIELIDELFSDVLWSVVVGFLSVGCMAISGETTDASMANILFTAFSLAFAAILLSLLLCALSVSTCVIKSYLAFGDERSKGAFSQLRLR